MIIYVIVGHSWCSWRNEGEFDRHRKNYQGLVTAIQAMNLPTNQSVYLRVDPDKNPVSLRPSSNFDKASEQIVARREPDGRLTLRVCTYSMGHAGVYGLFYSSGPPDKDEVKYSFGADGHIDPVGPGWWRVADFTQ